MMIKFYKDKPPYIVQTDAPVIAFVYQETGFWPIRTSLTANDLNPVDMTEEVIESAEIGSMSGWHVPGARLAKEFAEEKLKSMKESHAKS